MSAMTEIFKDTFAYLEQNIDQQFYCEDFKKADAKAFYEHLLQKYSKKEIKESRSEIRRAFKSFFQLLNQSVSLFFQGFHTIIIKDLKKQVFGVYSKQFHTMSHQLEGLNEKLDNFSSGNGVYMIDKEHLQDNGCDFENIEDKALKRELYKQAVKDALSLHERDLVFCMNDKLTIKKFIAVEATSKQQHIERRAGGLPPQELEKIKNIVFEKNIYDEIERGVNSLMETKLDFTIIDNDFFRKNAISLVQEELYKVISIYMDEDTDIALKKAFANYIFREHFTNIHKIFAKQLLYLHSTRDKNVESFLRYYDGNVELVDGKQVSKPEIIDENDQKWNAVSMLPIVIQKQKNDREIDVIDENNEKAEAKIFNLKHRIETIEEEIAGLDKNRESINQQVRGIITQTREVQDHNASLKKKQKRASKEVTSELQEEINKGSVEIKKLMREEDRLRVKMRDIGNSIELNKTKITNINVDINAQEKLIKDNLIKKDNLLELHQPVKEKYELIVGAIAKTLMHKF